MELKKHLLHCSRQRLVGVHHFRLRSDRVDLRGCLAATSLLISYSNQIFGVHIAQLLVVLLGGLLYVGDQIFLLLLQIPLRAVDVAACLSKLFVLLFKYFFGGEREIGYRKRSG